MGFADSQLPLTFLTNTCQLPDWFEGGYAGLAMLTTAQPSSLDRTDRVEWTVALLVTAFAVGLHLLFLAHAGGLWRDEAGMVALATLPSFAETRADLAHESCPVLFPAAIRLWSAAGLGGTDFGLRLYGFGIGLLLLGAVWLCARTLTGTIPCVSLGLLASNVALVRWGDSLRAYGTGSLLVLITVVTLWRFVISPSRGRWWLAVVAAVLSVHGLFQNAFLLLATSIAAWAVCLRRKDKSAAFGVLSIGTLAAVSLVPYVPIVRESQHWYALARTGFLGEIAWKNFSSALSGSAPWMKWIWIALILFALALTVRGLLRETQASTDREALAGLFCGVALLAGFVSYFTFIWIAGLPSQEWNYVPLLFYAAVSLDGAVACWLRARLGLCRFVVVSLIAAISAPRALEQLRCRQTSMDLIAADLNARAAKSDLILVLPWFHGISFQRYYHGAAPWNTVPQLADHRLHRYDLFKWKMLSPAPIQPVLESVEKTFRSGNRVWIVGRVPFEAASPPPLPPPPHPVTGWQDQPYSVNWSAQLGAFLATNAVRAAEVPVQTSDRVSPYEDPPIWCVTGWRGGTGNVSK